MEKIIGQMDLPSLDGVEVKPGVFLIGEPTPRPDLGPNRLECLANFFGYFCVVELSANILDKGKSG